jgi:hypothetical protein
MKCVICENKMSFFFSKKFNSFGLKTVDYWRCDNCGFCMSKTHADMTDTEWQVLNYEYHATYQGAECNTDDPLWIERLETQATVLNDAAEIGFLNENGRWLDYACGDGKLSELLKVKNRSLLKYDRYMPNSADYLDDNAINNKSFDFVITTSVFEHFTLRKQFDSVETLVSDSGVLGLHTLVCENIPCDSSWFYLLPVHCAFHTNKSMSLLFEQWGYISSVYNVEARLWFWFKQNNSEEIEKLVEFANKRTNKPNYIFKNGFVDYWK